MPCANCWLIRPCKERITVDAVIAFDKTQPFRLVDEIAEDGHGLVMLMGKGGVGKTTLAAAVAVNLAHAVCQCI